MEESELNLVYCKVNKALREYLLGIRGGSDLLYMDYKSPPWVMVKSRLRPVPEHYVPQLPGPHPDLIRIVIPSTTHKMRKIFNLQADRIIEGNPLFRHYLDEQGQKDVEELLMKDFKQVFRSYMTGAVTCNTELEIKNAIDRFCEVHNLEMDAITYEMLRKDWYRYRQRETKSEPAPVVKENF